MSEETTPVHYRPEDPHDRHIADLDLTRGMHGSRVRRLALVLAVAVPVLAVFNAQGLAKWSRTLPQSPIVEEIIIGSLIWHDYTRALGTADVFEAVRRAFYEFRERPSVIGAGTP